MSDIITSIYRSMKSNEQSITSVDKKPQIIVEKLSDSDKDDVDGWDTERPEHVQDKIDSVFGSDSRKIIGLGDSIDTEPHPEVAEHLEKHDHYIKNYVAGIAVNRKTGRDIGIGKLLSRTDAPKHVVSAYANDPVRQASSASNGDYHVVISHSPYDVAGMTSRGHSWYGESCMNFDSGSNRHSLRDEVRNGTHVAYLTHKSDTDVEAPIARLAIKPYHNEEDHTDVIFRPESRVYGSGGGMFHSTVSQWLQKNYPAKEDHVYKIAEGSYPDTSEEYVENSEASIKGAVERMQSVAPFVGDSYHGANIAMRHAIKINSEKNSDSSYVPNSFLTDFASTNTKIRGDHRLHNTIARAVNDSGNYPLVDRYARIHGNSYDTDNLEKAIKLMSGSPLPNNIISNPKLPDHIVDSLPHDKLSFVNSKKIKPEHLNKVVDAYLNNESGSAYSLSDMSKKFDESHANRLIDGIVKNHGSSTGQRLVDVKPRIGSFLKNNPEFHRVIHEAIKSSGGSPSTIASHVASIPPEHLIKSDVDEFHDAVAPDIINNGIKEAQFKRLAAYTNNRVGGMSEEVAQHAVDRLMDTYGLAKSSVAPSKATSLQIPEVPSKYIRPEHIEKIANTPTSLIDMDHSSFIALHNNRLGKIAELTHKYITEHEDDTKPEEVKQNEANKINKLHEDLSYGIEDHLNSSHMEIVRHHDDDSENHAPSYDHVDELREINERAEDLESDASNMGTYDSYSQWHSDNRHALREKEYEVNRYHSRYEDRY